MSQRALELWDLARAPKGKYGTAREMGQLRDIREAFDRKALRTLRLRESSDVQLRAHSRQFGESLLRPPACQLFVYMTFV